LVGLFLDSAILRCQDSFFWSPNNRLVAIIQFLGKPKTANKMHSQLLESYKELVETSKELLSELSEYSIEILQKQPRAEKWSVVQIVNHLILAESMSLGYIKKKVLAVEELEEVGFRQNLTMNIMKLAQRSSRKFKAPAPVSQPESGSSHDDLRKDWEAVQLALKSFLDQFPDQYVKKALYKHPFAGRLSLSQMMKVHVYHINRHQSQIDALLKNFQ
jgi:uncharacterized damage-inducible protein DinB